MPTPSVPTPSFFRAGVFDITTWVKGVLTGINGLVKTTGPDSYFFSGNPCSVYPVYFATRFHASNCLQHCDDHENVVSLVSSHHGCHRLPQPYLCPPHAWILCVSLSLIASVLDVYSCMQSFRFVRPARGSLPQPQCALAIYAKTKCNHSVLDLHKYNRQSVVLSLTKAKALKKQTCRREDMY